MTMQPTNTASLIATTGYGPSEWAPDTDGGMVLAVSGDSDSDVSTCIANLESAGLQVSESRDETGRWIRVVAPKLATAS